MSLQLPAILSPPTPCIPSPALTVSPLGEVAEVALPFTGRRPVLGFAFPTQARQCIRPYRVQHCFIYGLAVRLQLPPTPSLDDAVTFDYGQPVFCPMGTSAPLLVRTLFRSQAAATQPQSRKSLAVGSQDPKGFRVRRKHCTPKSNPIPIIRTGPVDGSGVTALAKIMPRGPILPAPLAATVVKSPSKVRVVGLNFATVSLPSLTT